MRRLAKLSATTLGLAYTVSMFPVVLVRVWAQYRDGLIWLNVPAGFLGLALVSLLFTVVALYGDEDTVDAGVLLAAITGIGTGVDVMLVSLLLTGSAGFVAALGVFGLFVIPMQLVILAVIFTGLVWLARNFRRYLAPDTMPLER